MSDAEAMYVDPVSGKNWVALEGVNADCHKIDVFVMWPGVEKPMRPQIVGFQDLYSNKILAWRVDRDPNKVAVMSAFGSAPLKPSRKCLSNTKSRSPQPMNAGRSA